MRLSILLLSLAALAMAGPAMADNDPDGARPDSAIVTTTAPIPPAGPTTRGPGVFLDTDGNDNYSDGDFYGVTNSGTVNITSVTIDISIISGAFFDLDGGSCYQNATDPVIGATGGMTAADVTWTYDAGYNHPVTITANFSPAMAPGAFFRFGCDTDWFVTDPCPGGNFGTAPAKVTVKYAGGGSDSGDYVMISSTRSECTLGGGSASVDIKCNGGDSAVMVPAGTNCKIDFDIVAGPSGGTPVDIWIVLVTPFGPFCYNGTGPVSGWNFGVSFAYFTGPLADVSGTCLDRPLPPGNYKAHCGLDVVPNGSLDLGSVLLRDVVDFQVF